MSSRFVSAGTDQAPAPIGNSDDWERAKKEVESRCAVKFVESGKQDDGKSLYDVLQANKAAKDEAFEEASKLRNQFRPLDDSEIEFLDAVRDSERAEEDRVKCETAEQLDQFRKQRIAAEQAAIDSEQKADTASQPTKETSWVTSKKRRREKADEQAPSLKLKKISSDELVEKADPTHAVSVNEKESAIPHDVLRKEVQSKIATTSKPGGLGLGAYDSETDDD